MTRLLSFIFSIPARSAIGLIRIYQKTISPLLGPRCKYYPPCSEYAASAVGSFGLLRGSVLAVWRILRCNPWSKGGVDHPEDQRLFAGPRPPAPTP